MAPAGWYLSVYQLSGIAWAALWLAQVIICVTYRRLSRWMWLLAVGAALELIGSAGGRILFAFVRPGPAGASGAGSVPVMTYLALSSLLSLGSLVASAVYVVGLAAVLSDVSRRLPGRPGEQAEPVEQPLWPDG